MRAVNKKIEYNVLFWSSLGPFLLILTLFATMLRGGVALNYLSIVALLGVPLCWAWKWRGFALTLLMLVAGAAYVYPQIEDPFWFGGVISTLMLGALITTLSFEEVISVIQALENQGKNRLDQLLNLDEKTKQQEKSWHREKEVLDLENQQIRDQLNTIASQVEIKEKLALILQEECQMLQDHQNTLRKEHITSAEQHAKLRHEFEEIQRVLWKYQENESTRPLEEEQPLNELKECLSRREDQLQSLQEMLKEKESSSQHIQQEMETEIAQLQKEMDDYKTTITRQKLRVGVLEQSQSESEIKLKKAEEMQEVLKLWELSYHKLQQENERLQQLAETTVKPPQQEQVEVVAQLPDQVVRKLEGMYKQLRAQFDEKNEILHKTRRELFKLETQAIAQEMKDRWQEHMISPQEMNLEKYIVKMNVEYENYEEEIAMLEGLVSALVSKNR